MARDFAEGPCFCDVANRSALTFRPTAGGKSLNSQDFSSLRGGFWEDFRFSIAELCWCHVSASLLQRCDSSDRNGLLPNSLIPEPSDRSLLRRFRAGEQEAATRLYLRYAQRLHGLAIAQTGSDLQTRMDPDDIVQSVFRTFFRRAQEGHYQVPDGEELWKLFLVIGLNKIRDAAAYHRASKRDVSRTTSLDADQSSIQPVANDMVAENSLRMVIEELLTSLSESQKDIVILRLEGAQVEEIAAQTKRSHRTVERTLQKFRELLRLQIDDVPHLSKAPDVPKGSE